MSNRVIEKYCCSKAKDESKNEDAIFENENFIAVIDGATSKSSYTYKGKTCGVVTKEIILSTLSKLNGNEDAICVFKTLFKALNDFAKKENTERLSASIVIYSIQRGEIWSLGDCAYRFGDTICTSSKKIDALLSEARSLAIKALLKTGVSVDDLIENDISREYIMPFLKSQMQFENVVEEYGYFVLNSSFNPEKVTDEMIQIAKIEKGTEIIFTSDGYPKALDTLSKSEEYLSYILEEDPLCYKIFKSTKGLKKGNLSFDDRSYIRFIG